MTNKLVELIVRQIHELKGELLVNVPANLNPGTALFGQDGLLDSMALVTLVVALEQSIEDTFGVAVTLADARAMSQKHSPFRTIGSLAEYSGRLVQEAK